MAQTQNLENLRYFGHFSSVFDRKWPQKWENVDLRPRNQLKLDAFGFNPKSISNIGKSVF
jgi:hypothetical protein